MTRHNPARPDPDELRVVARLASAVAEDLDHAVAAARSTGIPIDVEVVDAVKVITSWAKWLAARATRPHDAKPE